MRCICRKLHLRASSRANHYHSNTLQFKPFPLCPSNSFIHISHHHIKNRYGCCASASSSAYDVVLPYIYISIFVVVVVVADAVPYAQPHIDYSVIRNARPKMPARWCTIRRRRCCRRRHHTTQTITMILSTLARIAYQHSECFNCLSTLFAIDNVDDRVTQDERDNTRTIAKKKNRQNHKIHCTSVSDDLCRARCACQCTLSASTMS